MDYQSFKKLARLLHAGICEALGQTRLRRPNYRHVPNGPISTSVRLACSLRFFAGGSPYDIMSTYQIGHTDFFKSVWSVVKAINEFAGFCLSYPTSHEKQHKIAAGFQKVSAAGFNCCAGAIDGILIWITKPSEEQCEKVGCSEAKFFCARKHKFGMNCQAICDVCGRFLDVSILYPGSTSDCLAFEGMALFTKLENCLLAPGLCFFGDNAYINCHFMATPFSGTAGGSKDAYNFYHSQLRIRIECAFGILTSRWAILRKALPANITIKRGVALVVALARLHNFCIDETDAKANVDSMDTTSCVVPALPARDELDIEQEGAVPVDPTPEQLLHGGQHFDDIDVRYAQRTARRFARMGNALLRDIPRNRLHSIVANANLTRPSQK